MKLRKSTQIAIGFVAVVAGVYFGYHKWADAQAFATKLDPILPKKVNIIGIAPGRNYQIIVANQVAALTYGESASFEAPDKDSEAGETTGRKRVPIRELVLSLQGDREAFTKLLMKMNDLQEETLPPEDRIWDAEDVRKALAGDAALADRLTKALNVTFDGQPLRTLDRGALFDGIVIRTPITMTVTVGGKATELVGYVRQPYRPGLMRSLEKQIEEKGDLNDGVLGGYYRELAQPIWDGEQKGENVRGQLESRIAPRELKQLEAGPRRIIESAEFVINEDHIRNATYEEVGSGRDRRFNLRLDLTEEGRLRLWQYSRKPGKLGSQLLLVVDGIPIAAPQVDTELSGGQVTIKGLPDETLVKDAVNLLARLKGQG